MVVLWREIAKYLVIYHIFKKYKNNKTFEICDVFRIFDN